MSRKQEQGTEVMSEHRYRVVVFVDLDETFTVTDSDIRGLVLDSRSFREMRYELLRVGARLLSANHGLADHEVGRAMIHVKVRVELEVKPTPTAVRGCGR